MSEVNVTLNTLDDEGNIVDTDNQDLSVAQVSDIIDHSAQLAIVEREYGKDSDQFQVVFNEMCSALESAGVI